MDNRYAHRRREARLRILGPDGAPLCNREVRITQTKHGFLFGCAEFSAIPYANGELEGPEREIADRRFERMFELFNFVTMPFYWGRYEGKRGEPDEPRTRRAAEWLKSRGMILKGHPLCWHTSTAPWLLDLSDEDILKAQIARIHRDVSAYQGVIDMWDVINEVVIMPVFDRYDNGITRICRALGRIPLVRRVFEAARESNPGATLLINDFNTTWAYDILIEGLLEAGVPIGAIGIQSHMHQGYWGVEKTEEILARFSRFGLPLHFTENTLVSGTIMPPEIEDLNDYQVESWPTTPEGEERQAREAETHYRTLFAHPQVASITWWDFVDGNWLRAPSGLLRADSSPKPSYDAIHSLVKKEWWTGPSALCTDEEGYLTVAGYKGDYRVQAGDVSAGFTLGEQAEIRLS